MKKRRHKRPWHRLRVPGFSFIEPVIGSEEETLRALKNSLCKFNQTRSNGILTPKVHVEFNRVTQKGKKVFEVRSRPEEPKDPKVPPRVYAFYTFKPGEARLFRLTEQERQVYGDMATQTLEKRVKSAAKNYKIRHDQNFEFQVWTEVSGVIFKRVA